MDDLSERYPDLHRYARDTLWLLDSLLALNPDDDDVLTLQAGASSVRTGAPGFSPTPTTGALHQNPNLLPAIQLNYGIGGKQHESAYLRLGKKHTAKGVVVNRR